ncbi:MAG: hypothetical protein NPIRA02_38350 [Nitrospirales bacterium]|nr:MAG: hypothetical protein NPIRA02_38350 [Nitrospirales bacterium]
MSWIEPLGKGHILKFAVQNDGRWTRQGEVALGDKWFINWADFPSVHAINQSFWVAHWLVKHPKGRAYDYDIDLSISTDAGVTWSDPTHPHRDGVAAEHGFATIFPVDDEAGIIWLDGREYQKPTSNRKDQQASGNYTLRYTRIDRKGNLSIEQIIDHNTCTCCGTSVAVTTVGPMAAWRGRTEKEIRDNHIAHLEKDKWTTPQPLGAEGWKIPGCPVNGPVLAAQGMNVIGTWYTEEGDRPRVRAAVSDDGGQTFTPPIDIDDMAPFGRMGVTWSNPHTAIVTWITAPQETNNAPRLALRTLSRDGKISPVFHLAEISQGRNSGFPQIHADQSGLLVAWTNAAPDYGIHTSWIPAEALAH